MESELPPSDERGRSEAAGKPESWDEETSQDFLDYGRYFVPDREQQIGIITSLIPPCNGPATVLDLACGEGLLAESILEKQSNVRVVGLDGSRQMRHRALARLSRFGERFLARAFDLADTSWRQIDAPIHGVVSSLAIHHLDGPEKQSLFQDMAKIIAPGGVFIVADLVAPADKSGWQVAAEEWDEAVRERALELDGNLAGFEVFERMRWNTYRYFDPEDIDKPSRLMDQLKWLEQAGFIDVDVFYLRAGHAIFGGRKQAAG
jgi:tRNA (cmo5U34)-methyltransferase